MIGIVFFNTENFSIRETQICKQRHHVYVFSILVLQKWGRGITRVQVHVSTGLQVFNTLRLQMETEE